MITKIDGWQSSDGSIYKTEAEAIDHENFLTTYKTLKELFIDQLFNNTHAHTAAYVIATNRKIVYDVLKDNI